MTRVTASLSVSIDGFSSGPKQSKKHRFGEGVDGRLHRWMFEAEDYHASEIAANVAPDAFVMGRNTFGPVRGKWGDSAWSGWWGSEPLYHAPVFVLTHHAREPLPMEGGTTFTFVTDGIEAALERASEVAGAHGSVGIAGGASTVRQYLDAGLVDELRLQIVPILLSEGTRFTDGLTRFDLEPVAVRQHQLATHVMYRRTR